MKDATLEKSSRKDKKLMLKVNGDTIHFGAKGYSDFTKHKDNNRKDRYIGRHEKNEDWNKLNAGALSRFVLWNKPTIAESLKDVEKKFNLKIKNKVNR